MEKLLSVLITQWNYSLEKYRYEDMNHIARNKVLKLAKYLWEMNSFQEFFKKQEIEEH